MLTNASVATPPTMAPKLATPINGDRAAGDFVSSTAASTAVRGGAGVWAGASPAPGRLRGAGSLAVQSMDSCSCDRFSSTTACMATLVPSQAGRQLHQIALRRFTKPDTVRQGATLTGPEYLCFVPGPSRVRGHARSPRPLAAKRILGGIHYG